MIVYQMKLSQMNHGKNINFSVKSLNKTNNFYDLLYLKELYLNRNKLKHLNNLNLFSSKLLRLKILNLDSNEISFMDKNLFSNFGAFKMSLRL